MAARACGRFYRLAAVTTAGLIAAQAVLCAHRRTPRGRSAAPHTSLWPAATPLPRSPTANSPRARPRRSILAAVLSLAIITPLGWMTVVWSAWQLAFALLITQMQFGCGRGCITKYAGFLDRRLGRGMFFMYVGVSGGNNAGAAPFHMVVLAYAVLAMCWFVGLYEICGSKGAPEEEPLTTPAGLAPLGAALCADSGSINSAPGGAAGEPRITVSVTPQQAANAASWAASNSCLVAQAAATRSNGGAGWGASPSSTC